MLDYAANGTAYWQGGRIAESFAASMAEQGRDPDAELAMFLGSGADPQGFWQQVDANFSAGRIKLVFVADTIPRELARIVEFLNEQMKADVRAVELAWFEGEGGTTALAPRIIGETERAQSEKAGRTSLALIGRDEWIAEHLGKYGPETIAAAELYIRLVDESGAHSEVTTAQGSIVTVLELPSMTMYPLTLSRWGKGSVQLCLSYLVSKPAFADDAARRTLYERLVAVVGPLSTKTLNGFPSFPATRLNDPAVQAGFRDFLGYLRDTAAAG